MQAHYLQFFSIEQKFEMTSQRGLLGSKANVKCDYCGREGRRDKISEHILKDHPGRDIKVTILAPKNTKTIETFFQSTKKDEATREVEVETLQEEAEEIANVEVTQTEERKRSHGHEREESEPSVLLIFE